MDKVDYRKVFREAYSASATPALVHVPPMQFLMVDGAGGPDEARFQAASETLLAVARTLKSLLKNGPVGLDFGVMPLEALWWTEESAAHLHGDARHWRLMIMQPPIVYAETVAEAVGASRAKQKLPIVEEVRFARFDEGKAVQLLHTGPLIEQGPAVERLHQFAAEQGFSLSGKRHEIYLSDPRRNAVAKWKTILRRPVERM